MAQVDFGNVGGKEQPKAAKKWALRVGVLLGVILLFGVVGFGLGKLIKPGPQTAAAQQPAVEDPEDPPPPPPSKEEYYYHEFEPVTVNLNEPRPRYLRAGIRLKIRRSHQSAVQSLLEHKQAEVRDWLIRYLSSLTMSDVLGQRNLNTVRRRIMDELNQMLWPNSQPCIEDVLLHEFTVS
jgi:flagellar basal body-associated protein FliL